MAYEFDVSTFNAAAKKAQRAAGVNPKKCIRLEEVPGGSRTPMAEYFEGLQARRLRVPALVTPRLTGDRVPWRTHDGKHHVRRAGALHPELAGLVQVCAEKGQALLGEHKVGDAKAIATRLDFFLADRSTIWRSALRDLVAIEGGSMPSEQQQQGSTSREDHLIAVQIKHFDRLSQHQPGLFSFVSLDEGLV